MSQTSQPYGLMPIESPGGGRVPSTAIPGGIASGYASNIGYFSPVIMNTSGNLTIATAAADIWGVFLGVEFYTQNNILETKSKNWLANSTYNAGTCIAYVCQDPNTQFKIQSNGILAQSAIGDEADFVTATVGSVNTLGFSTAQISSTLAGVGVQGQLRILNKSFDVNNDWGDPFTDVTVEIARWQTRANKVAI